MKINIIGVIILFVFISSISCVTAMDIDNSLNDSNNIYHDSIGIDITPNNPNIFSMINRLNKITDELISAKNITNSLLIKHNNSTLINKSDFKLNNNSSIINSTNISNEFNISSINKSIKIR